MIVIRVVSGIKSHIHIRATEWLMVYPAVGIGTALNMQPHMFETSQSFAALARIGGESTWSSFVLLTAIIRLIALTVNGTFKEFRYSPHMRMFASAAGIAFWSQFSLGFVTSALFENGAWTGPFAYSTFCLMELLNLYRSSSDIGRGRKP